MIVELGHFALILATCVAIIGSNNATNSEDLDPTIPGTGCAAYGGRDVWYKVIVPASGKVIVETSEDDLSISDGGMAIYSGSCIYHSDGEK